MVYFIISCSALCAAIGHILLKLGAGNHNKIIDFFNIYIILGCLLYGASMLLWIYSLSRVPLSAAFAFTMLTFTLVYLLSWLFLGEHISKLALLGIGLINIGMILISIGQKTN
jgi:probable 4-amino-4-deoxy-L-arabinose-phosphoundecaprenol flippase subunit arnE